MYINIPQEQPSLQDLLNRPSTSSQPLNVKPVEFKLTAPTAKDVYNLLPSEIKTILLTSEGWLVGSSVSKLLKGQSCKDFDILVPSRELFQLTAANMKGYWQGFNSFGGMKFECNGTVIDLWPEELGHFLQNCSVFDYVYSLKKQVLFKNHG